MSDRLMAVSRIIALCEIVLGLFLLLREMNDYTHLPTVQEANEMFGGILVDLFKYQENCYRYLYLYSLITLSGLSFWISKILHWGLSQMLVITLLFITIITLHFMSPFTHWFSIFLSILSLVTFIYLEFKMYSSAILNVMKVSKSVQRLSVAGGIMSCGIWWML